MIPLLLEIHVVSLWLSKNRCSVRSEPYKKVHDMEKGLSIADHIIFNVEGLTCVGCERKFCRALEAIPGFHNVQTSLVMSQAYFDIDGRA